MYIQYGVCQRPQPCQPVSYSSPTVPPGELVSKDSKLNPTKKILLIMIMPHTTMVVVDGLTCIS